MTLLWMIAGATITFVSIFGAAYLLAAMGVLDQHPAVNPHRGTLRSQFPDHEHDSAEVVHTVNIQRYSIVQRKYDLKRLHNAFVAELHSDTTLDQGAQYLFSNVVPPFPDISHHAREWYSRYRQPPMITAAK